MPPGPNKVVTEQLAIEVSMPRPPAFMRGMGVIALLAATGKWNVQV
jgi:hypothetical protein